MASRDPIRPGEVPPDVFSTFIERTRDFAIFALDPQGHVSSWNPGAERMKGWTQEEVLGKHFGVFYTATDSAMRRPYYVLQRATEDGRFEDEGWRVRKDGTMFWASVVVTCIRDAEGEVRGYVKLTRDLTTRRHAEEALRQGEERYRLLVESVKDYAIFVLDPRGHVMSWNAGAERLKGYKAEEIVGRHFSTFYPEAERARGHPEDELRIAIAEGRYEEEGWRVRKDGTTFWANVVITPLYDDDRRHIGFAKVTRDLTERKRAEDEIRARALSYADLNRELDAFSHTVAHDLRSPIRAVEHLTSLLLDEEGPHLSAQGQDTLRAIHQSSLKMARLVQDLLELSTAAGREPRRREVDLTRLAREILAELAQEEPKREIQAVVHEDMRALADPHLVRIALMNLLTNARKFTRGSPLARIEVGATSTPQGKAFFVRDNGAGFPSEAASTLFRPFTRLHPESRFEGTGIGLATVARVVRRHGGDVWAEGAPGAGATFYFTLPPPVNP